MRAAVHASDIDGIASAALLLMRYPNIEIDFLTLRDIKTKKEYDFVVDLPKLENGKINIDHHKTNYEKLLRDGQLSQKDLVDPNAPSAAQLLIKYLSLENNSRAIEIASMANDSDQGKYDEKLYLLDKIIKCKSGDPETLYKIAELLIRRGRKFTKDEFFKHELNQLIAVIKWLINSLVSPKTEPSYTLTNWPSAMMLMPRVLPSQAQRNYLNLLVPQSVTH